MKHFFKMAACVLGAGASLIPLPSQTASVFTHDETKTIDGAWEAILTYTIPQKQYLRADSISFSTSNPDALTLEVTSAPKASSTKYDIKANMYTPVYDQNGTFTLKLTPRKNRRLLPGTTDLTIAYQFHNVAKTHKQTLSIPLSTPSETAQPNEQPTPKKAGSFFSQIYEGFLAIGLQMQEGMRSLTDYVSATVTDAQTWWLQLIFVFLLGLLMSFTPCIYPMIPITIGILQTTSGTSWWRNFFLAGAYTLGIATTFAVLGLMAAFGGAQFGSLLGNPYFVAFLVLFLGYMALSMLGCYELYIPRFLQTDTQHSVNGSLPSAFVFGAISGSVASPCVSPGLLLLLSIVATLGSKLLGFAYLFLFGLGLGTPLLIIGTFSGALRLMPQAGTWMVEIKRIFGLMLLGMCFYYLTPVMRNDLVLAGLAVTLIACAVWYVWTISEHESPALSWYKWAMGALLLISAFFASFQAYLAYCKCTPSERFGDAITYEDALTQAKNENKLVLLDFGALWCTLCSEIDEQFIHNPEVRPQLNKHVVVAKIDCTDPSEAYCSALQQQFDVIGYPTLILLDPHNEKTLHRWGGELASQGHTKLLQTITNVA